MHFKEANIKGLNNLKKILALTSAYEKLLECCPNDLRGLLRHVKTNLSSLYSPVFSLICRQNLIISFNVVEKIKNIIMKKSISDIFYLTILTKSI